MADRSSRKSSKRKTKASGRPDLRKSHVATSGESKSVRDARRRNERSSERARAAAKATRRTGIPVRPDTTAGIVGMLGFGAVVIALVAWLGTVFHQWGLYGASESLWLYVLLGAVVAAAPVGFVSRTRNDLTAFAGGAGFLALAALLYERATFPTCPDGASCGAYGALAQWGLWGALVIGVVLLVAVYGITRLAFRFGGERRPAGVVTGWSDLFWGVFITTLLIGLPLAASLLFLDTVLRSEPARANDAAGIVTRSCFSDFSNPDLDVRPSPEGGDPQGTNFLVRQAGESRPEAYTTAQLAARKASATKSGGKAAAAKVKTTFAASSDWLGRNDASPYEAAVGVDGDGKTTSIDCRLITPKSSIATATDVDPTSASDLQTGASSLSTNGFTFANSAATNFLQGNDAKGSPFGSPATSAATAATAATGAGAGGVTVTPSTKSSAAKATAKAAASTKATKAAAKK